MAQQNKTLSAIDNGSAKIRFEANWYCNSLVIDNATNHWYYLENSQRYIPPQQLGMVVTLTPGARTVVISPSNPPSGGIANGTAGGTISVTFYESDLADTGGIDYSLVKAISDLNTNVTALTTAINNLRGGWGTSVIGSNTFRIANVSQTDGIADQILIPAVAGKQPVIMSLSVSWESQGTDQVQRGTIESYVYSIALGTIWAPTLTPETPAPAPMVFAAGSVVGAVNAAIFCGGLSNNDSILQDVNFIVGYYLI